jgi:hypothetical protein
MATLPMLGSFASAAAIFLWQRSVGALVVTFLSLGVALLAALLLVFVTHGTSTFYGKGDSVIALVGLPLVVYAITLAMLMKQAGIRLPVAIATGAAGLAGLWLAGGYVLMFTTCSFNTGGC